jgi:hypothetical protein
MILEQQTKGDVETNQLDWLLVLLAVFAWALLLFAFSDM